MARLRFKLEINPGGHGVRLDKLGKLSGSVERFLRNLADDAGAKLSIGDLVASDFYDSSFGSTVESYSTFDAGAVAGFDAGIEFFSSYGLTKVPQQVPSNFTRKTIQSFVALGDEMDNDEAIRIGLLKDAGEEPKWEKLTKSAAVLMKEVLEAPFTYQGSLQGRPATWYKESGYFNLKDFASAATVKCSYPLALYAKVYAAFEDKDAVVHLGGMITADRLTGSPTEMTVSDVLVYPRLSDAEFSALPGSVRDMIGDEDVVSFIDRMRGDAD